MTFFCLITEIVLVRPLDFEQAASVSQRVLGLVNQDLPELANQKSELESCNILDQSEVFETFSC